MLSCDVVAAVAINDKVVQFSILGTVCNCCGVNSITPFVDVCEYNVNVANVCPSRGLSGDFC